MTRWEYQMKIKEFNPKALMTFEVWLSLAGSNGWNLINVIPLQIFNDDVIRPGTVHMNLSFLCIYKRKRSWFKDWLFTKKHPIKSELKKTYTDVLKSLSL